MLGPDKKKFYQPPAQYDLPEKRKNASALAQIRYCLHRNFILAWRNLTSKVIDFFVVTGGIVLSCLLVGQLKLTNGAVPNIENEFRLLAYGDANAYDKVLTQIFATVSAETSPRLFATIVSVLACTLLALSSIKIMVDKRNEFFREAGSGHNVLSYFMVVNIYTLLEQGLQSICASLVALWLRNSLCKWWMYVLNFFFLQWGAVSWALLMAIIVPPKNIVLIISFFMVFSSFMLSGGQVGVKFEAIYKDGGSGFLGFICGMLSPARFFAEMMMVSEYRALDEQYGYTVEPPSSLDGAYSRTYESNMFVKSNLGLNDFNNFTKFGDFNYTTEDIPPIFIQSQNGWFWGIPPLILTGLTIRVLACIAILTVNRDKQVKQPVISWVKSESWIKRKMVVTDKRTLYIVLGLSILFFIFLALSAVTMLGRRETSIAMPGK